MSRLQLALNVDDLDQAVAFYSRLFNTQPAKLKEGYANFAVAEPPLKLVLLENPGKGGTINHLGVEVESSDIVHAEIARLTGEGLFTECRELCDQRGYDVVGDRSGLGRVGWIDVTVRPAAAWGLALGPARRLRRNRVLSCRPDRPQVVRPGGPNPLGP